MSGIQLNEKLNFCYDILVGNVQINAMNDVVRKL